MCGNYRNPNKTMKVLNFIRPLKFEPASNSDPSTEEGKSMTRLYYQRAGVLSRGGGVQGEAPP